MAAKNEINKQQKQ